MTDTQRVAWQNAYGFEDHLDVQERPIPSPGAHEVRVRVAAAGLNPVDWKIATSPAAATMFGATVPGGYGNDYAGVVDALGAEVDGWTVGDRVFGGARGHAIAEYTVVPAADLHRAPDALSLLDASTLAVAGRTATATIAALNLTEADTVLIGGAAGGVGLFAVQLAALTGAKVIATASPENHELLSSFGALAVDYHGDLAATIQALEGVTITAAADLQGSSTAHAAAALGVPVERIVAVGTGATDLPEGVRVIHGTDVAPEALDTLAEAIASKQVRVTIERTYPLDDIREAIAKLRTGHVQGKLAIVIDEDLAQTA